MLYKQQYWISGIFKAMSSENFVIKKQENYS